jgi:hypothetical protein
MLDCLIDSRHAGIQSQKRAITDVEHFGLYTNKLEESQPNVYYSVDYMIWGQLLQFVVFYVADLKRALLLFSSRMPAIPVRGSGMAMPAH